MLVLLQGLIPKKVDEEEGKGEKEKEEEDGIEDNDTDSSEEGDGAEGTEFNYLKPDNLL